MLRQLLRRRPVHRDPVLEPFLSWEGGERKGVEYAMSDWLKDGVAVETALRRLKEILERPNAVVAGGRVRGAGARRTRRTSAPSPFRAPIPLHRLGRPQPAAKA